MSGESRKSIAVALFSFAAGATLAAVLGNSTTRSKLSEGSKKLLRISRE
jgi:hypothetical protein